MPRDNKTSPQKRPVRRSAAAAKGKDDGAKVDSASRKRKGAADDDAPRLTRNKRSRAAADVGEWSAEDVSAYLGSLAVAPAAVEKIAAKAVDGPKLRALSAGALSWLPRYGAYARHSLRSAMASAELKAKKPIPGLRCLENGASPLQPRRHQICNAQNDR